MRNFKCCSVSLIFPVSSIPPFCFIFFLVFCYSPSIPILASNPFAFPVFVFLCFASYTQEKRKWKLLCCFVSWKFYTFIFFCAFLILLSWFSFVSSTLLVVQVRQQNERDPRTRSIKSSLSRKCFVSWKYLRLKPLPLFSPQLSVPLLFLSSPLIVFTWFIVHVLSRVRNKEQRLVIFPRLLHSE